MFDKNNKFKEMYNHFLETTSQSENLKLQNEFRFECNRFTKIAKKYSSNYQKIYSNLISKVVRKEYSTGGELLVRGYYCPSPIYDIVTSNCKRGFLLQRITSKSKPTFEYCFDKNNRLIIINYLFSNFTEILEYNKDIVIGITFSKDVNNEFISVIECKYDSDGRIISFIKTDSSHNNCCIDHLEKEIYTYSNLGLFEAEVFDYLHNARSGILNFYKYIFKHNEEGYLEEYKVENSIFEDDIYKVNIKRKI